MMAFKKKRMRRIPVFQEQYRQRFFGDPLHICFGCSHDNERGLKLNFFKTDVGGMGFRWQPTEGLESFHNIVHGGISATLLDEVAGVAIQAELNAFAFTISARVNYHSAVYRDRLVLGHARIVARYKRYVLVQGELFDEKGKILNSMTSLFYIPNKSTFKHVTRMHSVSPELESYVAD
jgi:uncharacterized protein (TIGR00369 family)